jgi:2-oxoacid:acceptor oxidoreductase gamma subunit (pyruvate/2-ketoisovalerate family)
MIGIRFHGRGGQGGVLASKILAQAFFRQGFYVQAFPAFGMERRGAAVAAYVRKSSVPILEREEVKDPGYTLNSTNNIL